jgi:hypothetical protein
MEIKVTRHPWSLEITTLGTKRVSRKWVRVIGHFYKYYMGVTLH